MKKILTFILGMAVVASCDLLPKSSSEKDEPGIADLEDMTFETEQLSYSYEEGKLEVSITADYPTDGNPLLCNAVREYISETLGGTYADDLDEGQPLIDFYGDEIKSELNDAQQADIQYSDDNEEYINGYYRHYTFKNVHETDYFVTYVVTGDIYMNGAHGNEFEYGMSFRKSDGRRFGTDMMRNLYTDDFYAIIKQGMMDYFSEYAGENVSTDDELKEYILTDDNVNYLPLPRREPYITSDGIVFIYQPYEISFYGAGMPTFSVPFEQMKPFLTQTALKMIHKEKK